MEGRPFLVADDREPIGREALRIRDKGRVVNSLSRLGARTLPCAYAKRPLDLFRTISDCDVRL